jgi:hypothetical protein
MITLKVTDSAFDINRTWDKPLLEVDSHTFSVDSVDLFDQNGYRLTRLEQLYAAANYHPVFLHGYEMVIRKPWIQHEPVTSGPHLNHAYLFERKGYSGEALQQLKFYAKDNNLLNKLIQYRGKWGVDFSLDYVDQEGNVMELLHFEYDSYNLNEVELAKEWVENCIHKTDWDYAVEELLKKKQEWINLGFFEQSKYKTDFFKLPEERFKMLAWY